MMTKTPRLKPTIFVATSSEGLKLGYAIQENLYDEAEVVLWSEKFLVGETFFGSLSKAVSASDFVILALSPDDLTRTAGGVTYLNLLFQAGLYVGIVGLERTFVVSPAASKRLPTDLREMLMARYDHSRQDLIAAVRPACTEIKKYIKSVGFRDSREHPVSDKTKSGKRPPKSKRVAQNKGRQSSRATPDRRQVFISYSHKDKRWLEKLRTLLVPSIESNTVFLWDDSMIKPGDEWHAKIAGALDAARVAVLLVSPDFLASRFISKVELPPLLDGAKKTGLRILWLYLRACDYERTAIAKYQAAHDVSKPLKALNGAKQDQELLNIVKKINEAAK